MAKGRRLRRTWCHGGLRRKSLKKEGVVHSVKYYREVKKNEK